MKEHPAISLLTEIIALLKQLFTRTGVRGGWSERAREVAILKVQSNEPCEASRRYLRWLDHAGVVEGPLQRRAAEVQRVLF